MNLQPFLASVSRRDSLGRSISLAFILLCAIQEASAQNLTINFRFDGQFSDAGTTQPLVPGFPGQNFTVDVWATITGPAGTTGSQVGLDTLRFRGLSSTTNDNAFATGRGIGVTSFTMLSPFNLTAQLPAIGDVGSATNYSTTSHILDGLTDFGGTVLNTAAIANSNTGTTPIFGGGSTGEAVTNGWEFEVGQFVIQTGTVSFIAGAATSWLPVSGLGNALSKSSFTVDGGTTFTHGDWTSGSAVSFVVLIGGPSQWTGSNGSNWADSRNWIGGGPGDIALFNLKAANSPLIIDTGSIVRIIVFDTANVNSMTIGTVGGNALLLVPGGQIETTATVVNPQTVNAPLVLNGVDYTFTSGASSSSATLSFGGGIEPRATSGVTTLTLNGSNTGANTISGVLADNGQGQLAITMSGTGVWILSGANTYTGNTTIKSGSLSVTGWSLTTGQTRRSSQRGRISQWRLS